MRGDEVQRVEARVGEGFDLLATDAGFGFADLRDASGFAQAVEFDGAGVAFGEGDFAFGELAGFGELGGTAVAGDFDFDARLRELRLALGFGLHMVECFQLHGGLLLFGEGLLLLLGETALAELVEETVDRELA